MRGLLNPFALAQSGIDITFTENGTYDLNALGFTGFDAMEFALLGPGGAARLDGYDGTQREGGDGGCLVYGRAIPYWGVRPYRLRITDAGCRIEAFSDPNWIQLTFATVGGGTRDTSDVWWDHVSSTIRFGGRGSLNGGAEDGPNNWNRRGGGAAGFLSDGQSGPTDAIYTADGKGGGGNDLTGNSNGALAGISPNLNGLNFGGGAGVEGDTLGTPGRPIARIMGKSSKTFPSGT